MSRRRLWPGPTPGRVRGPKKMAVLFLAYDEAAFIGVPSYPSTTATPVPAACSPRRFRARSHTLCTRRLPGPTRIH